ncbi:MAG TPA: ABC transporter ATP-binding protein [Synechococcales cyanobacterium M55_K2018_004]|nr:ABC transporter ATP-binding protein [Synechococcales cyanobacterium M55_K2018_004]
MKSDRIVYLEQVSKIYRSRGTEVYAARNITLDVLPGEFYSLLGSSGSGKTTTLRMIGGFEIPEYGRVYIGGEEVTTLPPYRRNVHTVFQSYALFPHLTVTENIAYPLQIARISRAEVEPRVQESLRMFRLEGLGDRRPSQLSGGQQQRVALARALISRPKVLLLDEPLSALDAKIRAEVRQELRELQQQTGITFIYVTHDQEEALALSDRIAVMANGQIEQVGTPRDIYDRPTSPFVAQFIGKANFLLGTVVAVQSDLVVVEVAGTQIWAIAPHATPPVGIEVTLMVRPERLRSNDSEMGCQTINTTHGRVEQITYVGQLLECQVETPIGRLQVTQLSGGELAPTLNLCWHPQDCIVLSKPA